MKSKKKPDTRSYSMRRRARQSRELRDRILDAAYDAFTAAFVSDVSLASIAAAAECSEQTIYRKFDSKEGLLRAMGEREGADMIASRDAVEPGDVDGAVARIMADYEEAGDVMVLLQAQVGRVDAIREMIEQAREQHHEWVRRVFSPWLERMPEPEATSVHGQLVVALDVQTWKRLRRDLEFGESQTQRAMQAMTEAVLARVEEGKG